MLGVELTPKSWTLFRRFLVQNRGPGCAPFGLNAHLACLGGAAILDMRIGYTPDDAYALLEALGPQGRQAYTTMLLTGDMLFPISYSLLFAAVAAWLLARVASPDCVFR